MSAKFEKYVSSEIYQIENPKTRGQKSVDPDVAAHYEPPHMD